ncbi:hypothetical protein B0H14DRAFT_3592726 [Mycena olivaceomarginata]|nr:hypothetical protein B0H14DRAFT_3592726 [Mycena olivaceomarginata]
MSHIYSDSLAALPHDRGPKRFDFGNLHRIQNIFSGIQIYSPQVEKNGLHTHFDNHSYGGGHEISEMLDHIAQYTVTLKKIESCLRAYQELGTLRRLFKQSEITAQLDSCETELKVALGIFYGCSGSLSLLPPSPKIFHGRESEVDDLINNLLTEPARVAILGPGGMGKTTLAIAALHDPKVADRYPTCYFIPCDSARTGDSLITVIASNLGLEASRTSGKAVVHYLSAGPPCLVILDNFETPWEPADGRAKVEEFLSLLTDVSHLALLITMRGAERPSKVQWTRPFLRPLMPLPRIAARQTFIDMADELHDDSDQFSLLRKLQPLRGAGQTLERWELERTALLSAGYDKGSNLEISIMLSLSSPRMLSSPHAVDLLSLMSLLSDGVSDLDLLQSNLPIPDIPKCKTTLIRTSLAYVDHAGRFKVLAPIREYIHTARPPSPLLVRPVRKHLIDLLKIWKTVMLHSAFMVDLTPRLVSNLGNLHNVLLHGLYSDDADLGESMRGIILFNHLSQAMNRGLTPLMLRLPEMLVDMNDHDLHGQFIAASLQAWQFYTIPNPEKSIDEAIEHFRIMKDLDGEARLYNVIADYYLGRFRDLTKAENFYHRARSLGQQCNSDMGQLRALSGLARIEWLHGNFSEGARLAYQAHRIAVAAGNLNGECTCIRWQALCYCSLGDLKRSTQLIGEGKELVATAGIQGGELESMLLNIEANVYQLKTEYAEARRIQEVILHQTSAVHSPVAHAYALADIAFLNIVTGASADIVSRNLDAARITFRNAQYLRGISFCAVFHADFMLREGQAAGAHTEYVRLFADLQSSDNEIACYCLSKLADPMNHMHGDEEAGRWAGGVSCALRCFGDVLARQGADDAALAVLAVTLEGFTQMDVHQSRAECMQTMGDIASKQGELSKASRLWKDARPLFERSLQAKSVTEIDARLAWLEQHHEANLEQLSKLHVPTVSVLQWPIALECPKGLGP